MPVEKYENGLFIFRRDLRIIDNIGLHVLNNHCKNIYTIFIFTPEQVSSINSYKSKNAVQFMIESLADLSSQIQKSGGKLITFYGNNDKIVSECIKAWKIDIVCFNIDITPYARERDDKIIKLCQHMKTYVTYAHDYYLHEPGTILNGTGNAYQKFTPYYNTCMKKKVDEPLKVSKLYLRKSEIHIVGKISLDQAFRQFVGSKNPDILVHGGRENAIKQLHIAAKNIHNYSKTHNDLSKPTSQLSAYIKFGCVSIREVYKTFRSKHDFIRQLIWRDFYAQVLFFYPHVLGHAMKTNYNKINWHHNVRWFKMWCDGTTGFPIVDAAMRELNQSGYMHNRARLIVSSFLIKTLLIDWRYGEKYFAKKLTDYDVASNNGNWQWTAGTGADSQPYFRVFNPWRQTQEYDPECSYIKKWIPELKDIDNKIILNWDTEWSNNKNCKYPKPICIYEEQKEKALKMYKHALY
jgi:deoxyribodipyrimidine photo-lyase